ncbi:MULTISPECIES: hypothetical protein [unclassified Olleya]|jgi:hypothetical protein|uniref:hypothetical protein n=1 Tax=unclassified Olleya TaxID=2615019 RepID=UPI0011AA90B3|nr:hypothetical protein [Olleya sp. Hel_I_94]TVZ46711.1 hypothetical protein JM82_1291 [Olleya sp. Hel_I_94]
MEEFLKDNYSILTKFFILVAVVSGLVTYKKHKGTPAAFFVKVLIYFLIVELIGTYSSLYKNFSFLEPIYNSLFRQNYWWYTIAFDIIGIVLFSLLFQKVIPNKLYNKVLKYSTYGFVLFSILYIIYNRDLFFFQFFPVIQITGALIILSCSVFYFIELLLNDKIIKFYKFLYFYIAIAIFIWWIVVTPLTFYDVYMVNGDWDYILLKWEIYLSLNFIMYISFAIGFLISEPENLIKLD